MEVAFIWLPWPRCSDTFPHLEAPLHQQLLSWSYSLFLRPLGRANNGKRSCPWFKIEWLHLIEATLSKGRFGRRVVCDVLFVPLFPWRAAQHLWQKMQQWKQPAARMCPQGASPKGTWLVPLLVSLYGCAALPCSESLKTSASQGKHPLKGCVVTGQRGNGFEMVVGRNPLL